MAERPLDEIEQIAQRAEQYVAQGKAFDNKGKLNLYRCMTGYGHVMVTVDRDYGTTPFMHPCPACEAMFKMTGIKRVSLNSGMMESACYQVHAGRQPVAEWYRPDSLQGLSAGEKEHVRNGGLLLRFIEKE